MTPSRASAIGEHLPYLRRYARAVTGSQARGDSYAAATLEAIVLGTAILEPNLPLKTALFRVMYAIDMHDLKEDPDNADMAHIRLSQLAPPHRSALLLHTIEELSHSDIAQIMQVTVEEVTSLIETAHTNLAASIAGHVMIIEDEALIAMDLQSVVASQGHTVTGIARTHFDAVELGKKTRPDLILADIQLADQSSGIDAVNDLMKTCGETPVIFITAFPEMLLTGERPEPAFVIRKPYTDKQVHSAVAQAMFFASAEGIVVPPDIAPTTS